MSHQDTAGEERYNSGAMDELSEAVGQVTKAKYHIAFDYGLLSEEPELLEYIGAK
jgi:hypothetical protein